MIALQGSPGDSGSNIPSSSDAADEEESRLQGSLILLAPSMWQSCVKSENIS